MVAATAMLEGMPEARQLRLHRAGGRCVIMVGGQALFDFDAADVAMRNMAIVTLRRLGFTGRRVAEVLGLTENYVATLHSAAKREGSAALIGHERPGRPRKLAEADWEQALAWREQGSSDAAIGRRLGVAHTTVARRLGPRSRGPRAESTGTPGGRVAEESLFAEPEPQPRAEPEPAPTPAPEPAATDGAQPAPGTALSSSADTAGGGVATAGARIVEGVFGSRYAGAMLLHAFGARADADGVLAAAVGAGEAAHAGPGRRFSDVALLSVTSLCFALGAATVEQLKHLTSACAGPLSGLAVLPDVRTLRPRLAAIADASDPLRLQAMFAEAMLTADPQTSGVYYVDDHFVPYTGAKPVAKGWNNKRGRAEKGHADTHVTSGDGRAVCFITGQPSGLTSTLPAALAELRKATPAGAKILLGFDRGGAYPQVFRHCRDNNVDWVTYRRAPLSVPTRLPIVTTITRGGRAREIVWADEMVHLKDYGQARQLTLFENGEVALQVLTSDTDACPAEILSWIRSRWREENFLKYASTNYGIDKICDYIADIQTNTKIIDNPARKQATTALRKAETALGRAREDLAGMLADPTIGVTVKNTTLIPAAEKKITNAAKQLAAAQAARDQVPAKLPANVIDPDAKVALLRTRRRGLQMVLRLLAHNAEHWLSQHLNAYLCDDDEYRAITRETIIRGLAGTITYTPDTITVELQQPDPPRLTRALNLLLDEINHTPPTLPGDPRPITYHLTGQRPEFNT